MEIVGRQLMTLFPTPLFVGRVSDLTLCDRLEAACRSMRAAKEGIAVDNVFTSPDNIQTRPDMEELVNLVLKESGGVLDFLKVKRDSHYITNMWANITHPNHRHALHIHPNCLLSGLIYVKTPKDCGATVFADPRPGARMIEPTYTEKNPANMGTFGVAPERGVLLIWPSFLPHAVERGHAAPDDDRIVIAFNVMIRGTITNRTAYLELK